MPAIRVLHVDDEPDIREVVEMSLALDPGFSVRSCACGEDGLSEAAGWSPHVILCDVMMPVMDGPTMLARLRERPQTAQIPVIFMTARAQQRELEHFKSIGAAGIICKPFDPMTLAADIRHQMRAAGIAALSNGFAKRLQSDATALAALRAKLADKARCPNALEEIRAIAHSLAGAAGIFGCDRIGNDAAALEETAIATLRGKERPEEVERNLDRLLSSIKASAH